MLSVAQKIDHLKKLGFSGDLTEVEKFYAGEKFNQNDENIRKLIQYSSNLWKEYSQILRSIPCASETEKAALNARKDELIEIAIPNHGFFANINDNFYCTVGAIDFEKNSLSSINKNVKFGKYTLAQLGSYALVGEDVRIGATFGKDIQPNQKIIISDDTWLCASSIVGVGATIAPGTVLGLGACVHPYGNTEVNSLALGNPATTKLIIDENYQSKKDNSTQRSDDEIDFIIHHIHNLGLHVDEAFICALKGEKYNCFSNRLAQIIDFSHNLSNEFNHLNTTGQRRHEIINILFPIRGENFRVGHGIFVDILGLAKIGNNVQIGNNAFFAGNVIVGDNVRAGSNLVFAGIGHELPADLRHIREYQGVNGEVCEIGKIQIAKNINIGNDCTFAPGSILTQNLPSYSYVIGQDKIFTKARPDKFADDFIIDR